ncbi:MAG: CapA family protein [Bacillota bacterium]|nr:CapA family protein [Bacillota bacterium]
MRIFIGGDIVPTAATKADFDRCDVDALFGSVVDLVKRGDSLIVNLECALTDSDTPIRKSGPNLRGKQAHTAVLVKLGVTAVGLSNNHVFDFGQPGYRDTLQALTDAGLPYTGVGENEQDACKPHFFECDGKRIAVIAVAEHEYSYALPDQPGVWGFDPFDTMEDISIAREQADFVIVLYHGGKEQSPFPSPRLRKACQAMVRAGAGAVFCQHSHCIGTYETYRDAHIVYGQGNFNFVGHADHSHWHSGLLVALDLDNTASAGITFHPVVVTDSGITLAAGEEKQTLLEAFQKRNLILQNEAEWLAEWHEFCLGIAKQYRRAVAEAFKNPDGEVPEQMFPHYLDCEAHTDVWRELFPTWHKNKTSEMGTY